MSAGILLALSSQRTGCSGLASVTCPHLGTFYSFFILKSSNLSCSDLKVRVMTLEL